MVYERTFLGGFTEGRLSDFPISASDSTARSFNSITLSFSFPLLTRFLGDKNYINTLVPG